MLPVDPETKQYSRRMVDAFNELIAPEGFPWKLEEILPEILLAGDNAGCLTEEGARQALLEWLGQPGTPLTSLGRSEDGMAYRFQTEDGALYSVPLDGSPITAEPS